MTATKPAGAQLPHLRLSPMARQFLDELVFAGGGARVLVLQSCCAAPTVVHIVPARDFRPKRSQVCVATLAGHPVWGDEADLRTCPHESLVLVTSSAHLGRSRLVARADDRQDGRRP